MRHARRKDGIARTSEAAASESKGRAGVGRVPCAVVNESSAYHSTR